MKVVSTSDAVVGYILWSCFQSITRLNSGNYRIFYPDKFYSYLNRSKQLSKLFKIIPISPTNSGILEMKFGL